MTNKTADQHKIKEQSSYIVDLEKRLSGAIRIIAAVVLTNRIPGEAKEFLEKELKTGLPDHEITEISK